MIDLGAAAALAADNKIYCVAYTTVANVVPSRQQMPLHITREHWCGCERRCMRRRGDAWWYCRMGKITRGWDGGGRWYGSRGGRV